ncbi:MAG: hypothetical protein RL649_471 [Actinomycetota bacterium]
MTGTLNLVGYGLSAIGPAIATGMIFVAADCIPGLRTCRGFGAIRSGFSFRTIKGESK